MNDGLEQAPARPDRRVAERPRKFPVLYLYDHLGGKVMTVAWVGFIVGLFFTVTDYFWQYLALFGGTLGLLIGKATAEDIFVTRTKIQRNGAAKPPEGAAGQPGGGS
jgi:hypothetical protein